MIHRFILNETSFFGPGARTELPEAIRRIGKSKVLIVTDKGLLQFGVAKMVTDVLDQAGISYEIFSEVKPNPTVSNVKAGIEDVCTPGNPRPVTGEDVTGIYRSLL